MTAPTPEPAPLAPPTMEDLRVLWRRQFYAEGEWAVEVVDAMFDRALAAHDTQVLKGAADRLREYWGDTPTPTFDAAVESWLRRGAPGRPARLSTTVSGPTVAVTAPAPEPTPYTRTPPTELGIEVHDA